MKRIPQTEISQATEHPGRLRALAASARLANVPSVASNVCVGVVIAASSGADASMIAARLPLVIASGICLYLAGNFLNDWSDREWDEKHRPERALPRGLFTPGLYLTTAIGFALLGMGLAAEANLKSLPAAAAIMAFVLIYTYAHKRSAWSVIPMGLCRALLPLLGFLGCSDYAVTSGMAYSLAPGLALFCYVSGLSLSARNETTGTTSWRWIPAGLFLLAGITAALPAWWFSLVCRALGASTYSSAWILPIAAYAIWMLVCLGPTVKTVPRLVSNLLAGIPLVDWIFILPLLKALEKNHIMAAGNGFFWVPPLAVLAGLALQRLAPAT